MSFGVFFCMFAAITVVPSLIVIIEKDKPEFKHRTDKHKSL
jgi:predicted RND superfamily exporter protein